MRRISTRLADGRELIYFDDTATADRADVVDTRELDEATTSSELRLDPLLDEWVVIATQRQGRTHLPLSDECPLCPSTATRQTEIPAADYDVVVFENRFPSLSGGVASEQLVGAGGDSLDERRPGTGRCEVVCFTPDHDASFTSLTPERVMTVMQAWADRTTALSALPGVEQVFPFENRGVEIGVTLSHPHGQIYAYPYVTPRTRQMLDVARRHDERHQRNLFADVLAHEQAAGTRVVCRSSYWTAFVPNAARWPMEVHIYPHRQVPDLAALDDAERADFATVYLDVLGRFDRLYSSPMPYVAAWHQAPVHVDRELGYLHLELFSVRRAANKLKYLAGSESAMGAFVNDVLPEQAAQMLRDAGR